MSNKDRKRAETTGLVFRDGKYVDATEARELSDKEKATIHQVGYSAMQAMGTGNQVKLLRDSLRLGKLSPAKLRDALENNAPKEMRKGAEKLRKQGKPVTVDALMTEYRKDRDFRELAAEVGLDENWFIELAKKECV